MCRIGSTLVISIILYLVLNLKVIAVKHVPNGSKRFGRMKISSLLRANFPTLSIGQMVTGFMFFPVKQGGIRNAWHRLVEPIAAKRGYNTLNRRVYAAQTCFKG